MSDSFFTHAFDNVDLYKHYLEEGRSAWEGEINPLYRAARTGQTFYLAPEDISVFVGSAITLADAGSPPLCMVMEGEWVIREEKRVLRMADCRVSLEIVPISGTYALEDIEICIQQLPDNEPFLITAHPEGFFWVWSNYHVHSPRPF